MKGALIIAMSENNNTPAQTFLNSKLELAKEIDKAQRASRAALKLACESGSADIVMQMAIAIETIDKAWHINQEQVKEFWDATTPKIDTLRAEVSEFSTSREVL